MRRPPALPLALAAILLLPLAVSGCGTGDGPDEEPAVVGEVPIGFTYQRRTGDGLCEQVRVSNAGIFHGLCGARESLLVTDEPGSPLPPDWLHRWGDFELESDGERLVYRGFGEGRPGEAERRAIVEWMRRLAAGEEGYGIALAWRRGTLEGLCNGLTVWRSGEVEAETCGGLERRDWLDEERLERLQGFLDRLRPFQSSLSGEGRNAAPGRLVVAGGGDEAPSGEDVARIARFAEGVHRELVGPAVAVAAPPDPDAPRRTGTAGTGTLPTSVASEQLEGPLIPEPGPRPERPDLPADPDPDAVTLQPDRSEVPQTSPEPLPEPPPSVPEPAAEADDEAEPEGGPRRAPPPPPPAPGGQEGPPPSTPDAGPASPSPPPSGAEVDDEAAVMAPPAVLP